MGRVACLRGEERHGPDAERNKERFQLHGRRIEGVQTPACDIGCKCLHPMAKFSKTGRTKQALQLDTQGNEKKRFMEIVLSDGELEYLTIPDTSPPSRTKRAQHEEFLQDRRSTRFLRSNATRGRCIDIFLSFKSC